jgi:dTDP-4-dehydrorhamnose reductase
VRTNFFGWSHRGDRSVLEFFVNSLRSGTAVRGYPDFVVTSIYAQSLLQAIWDLETIGTTGLLHVASSDALSKYDYGLAVAREFGLDSELISPLPAEAGAHTSSRSRDISLNTDLFASIRGEPAQTQRAGIANARIDESRLRSKFHPTDHI